MRTPPKVAARPATALLVVLAVVATGCGTAPLRERPEGASEAYAGPMRLPQRADAAKVAARAGAAALALECVTEVAAGGSGNYDSGPESLQRDAESALGDFLDAEAAAYGLPDEGYAVERDDGERVLFSYDVQGRSVVAVIAHDAVAGMDDEVGWGVEAWAACDPADLPERVAAEAGVEVWSEADGTRVATSRVSSADGPEHCDWQTVRFLRVGERLYLRDPDGVLAELTDGRFAAGARLPQDARDTGWQRDGWRLWLQPRGAAFLVRLADPDVVERWPAADPGLACA